MWEADAVQETNGRPTAATKKGPAKAPAKAVAASKKPAKKVPAASKAPTKAPAKAPSRKAPAKKAPAKKAATKRAPVKKASAPHAPVKKAVAKKTAAKKPPVKKATAKKTATKRAPATKAPTTKVPAKRAPARPRPRFAKIVQAGPRDALPDGVLAQIDTTPEDAAGAILLAAMELMGSKGPAKVSLRDIASRAGVNYGLIHRHFGTKDSLLLSIFQAFTDYGATIIRGSDTIHEAVEGTFNADSGRYADLLASAVLDGLDPHRVYIDSSGMADFAAHISEEWGDPSSEFERRTDFDPRVVGSFVMLMIVVWDFYAPYMQVVNGYEDRDLADVRAEALDLMKFLVTATAPDA